MHTAASRVLFCAVSGVVALLAAGCGLLEPIPEDARRDESSGQITAAADADVFQLVVGDCLAEEGPEGEVSSVPTVPCSEPHSTEVFFVSEVDDAEFPGDDAMGTRSEELCYDEFEGFVGMAYEDSVLDFSSLLPTESSWGMGDREITCLLVDLDGGVTGTLEGAAR